MSADESYFSATEGSFWLWQDEGKVAAWSDGATIVFRPELLVVFRRLRSQSLPPFGALLLLLSACRENWRDPPRKFEVLDRMLAAGNRPDRRTLLERVCEKLDRVRALDSRLRSSAEAKAELASMVFEEQSAAMLPAAYERLVASLESGLSEYPLQPLRMRSPVDRLLRDLAWLDRGLDRVDAAALAMRLKTGLEQLPTPVEPIELPSAAARRLIAELRDDEQLGGVARLARLLLAAVHVPTPLRLAEELPLGGVSDISNRGTLDRLLLSELAHDGLTLAVRVAMNEALYLRRETPPKPPTRRRFVLLDSGLRMWGVPRVFASAVGLAVVAGANDGMDVAVFRARGNELVDVDFTTSAGLTEHLAALDYRAHPGAALSALAAEADEAGEEVDVVIVTGDDVYADHEFQRSLGDARFGELCVATVGRDGDFCLHAHSSRGRKVLRRAQFALDDVLHPPTKPTAPLVVESDRRLPAIFSVSPFPLRLSVPVDADRSWYVPDFGVLTYTRDGRLLHWSDPPFGARQLADDLPSGKLHWAQTRSFHDEVRAVVGKLSRDGLRQLSISTIDGSCQQLKLNLALDSPQYAFIHDGYVFVGNQSNLTAYNGITGDLVAKVNITGMRHARTRFFYYQPGVWRAASFNGLGIVFTDLDVRLHGEKNLETVFESDDFEGPLGITPTGKLIHFGTGTCRSLPLLHSNQLQVLWVSRDGRRAAVMGASRQVRTVELALEGPGRDVQDLEPELRTLPRPVTLRHRFSQIGIDGEGRLVLVGKRDLIWPLTYNHQKQLLLASKPESTVLQLSLPFKSIDSLPQIYGLQEAVFADGSRAVLDARGLLHLISSQTSVPEMSIVLIEGATAGWASTGHVWGPAYFHGLVTMPKLRPFDYEMLAAFLRQLT